MLPEQLVSVKEKEEGAALLCSAIVWTESHLPVAKGVGRSM